MSETITVNGTEYHVEHLPQEIKDLVAIYKTWTDELSTARIEVFKLEGAISSLTKEIEARISRIK